MKLKKQNYPFTTFFLWLVTLAISCWVCVLPLAADTDIKPLSAEEIEKEVTTLMEEGDIPGLSLVIIRAGEPVYIKGFGVTDLESRNPVQPGTLFELCSVSKAFTALAVLKCREDGLLDLDAPVSKYLPWFDVRYKGEKVEITLRQLLHQTSGIPFRTVSNIPPGSGDYALKEAVCTLIGFTLAHRPGDTYVYATINYDILGAVIKAATGMRFEEYV